MASSQLTTDLPKNAAELRDGILFRLGIEAENSGASYGPWIQDPKGSEMVSYDPSDGLPIAKVQMAAEEDYDEVVYHALKTSERWKMVPAPRRGQIVREIGEELRKHKEDLGALVS